MLIWHPDFCPGNNPCAIEIERDWSAVRQFIRACPHHQSLRSGGMSDQEVFTAILQSSRAKEAVRWALKLHMTLDKEHPGLPFVVAADGSISVRAGLTGPSRTTARNVANTALSSVSRPPGTSTVTVD